MRAVARRSWQEPSLRRSRSCADAVSPNPFTIWNQFNSRQVYSLNHSPMQRPMVQRVTRGSPPTDCHVPRLQKRDPCWTPKWWSSGWVGPWSLAGSFGLHLTAGTQMRVCAHRPLHSASLSLPRVLPLVWASKRWEFRRRLSRSVNWIVLIGIEASTQKTHLRIGEVKPPQLGVSRGEISIRKRIPIRISREIQQTGPRKYSYKQHPLNFLRLAVLHG
jgi:hypothetical protein